MEFIATIPLSSLPDNSHTIVKVKNKSVALFRYNGIISALGNTCLHRAGPLGKGRVYPIDGKLNIECPWHGYQYDIQTGKAPGDYSDQQSVFEVKVIDDLIHISEQPVVKAKSAPHAEDPLEDLKKLQYQTTPDSMHVLGISTTNLNAAIPRPSTSEEALEFALKIAENDLGAKTKLIRLRDLEFRACEGYYSLHEKACTWPCSISEMNPDDGMNEVYRSLVLWADVIIVSTPIRWGNASSLYYKMCERLNCVQNQITLHDKILIKNKVAGFIITGGQDNIQNVAGQMSVFFTELGFTFPPFNFSGWSRGWMSEDMEHNIEEFRKSAFIKRSVKDLITNCISLSRNFKQLNTDQFDSPLPKRKEISPASSGIQSED